MKNCPNCGAPFELNEYKCPYCGTLYLDLSMIDFDTCEPFYLFIKKEGYLITQKVKPYAASLESTCEQVFAINSNGTKLSSFISNKRLETNVQFLAIPDNNNSLCTIIKKEK